MRTHQPPLALKIAALLGATLTWGSSPALAQSVTVVVNDGVAQHYHLDADAIDQGLTSLLEQDLHLVDLNSFLVAMANADMLSTKGMGADYASNVRRLVVGGGVGTAVNSAGIRLGKGGKEIPDFGFAFQATAMAGVNLGFLLHDEIFFDRMILYVNGMKAETSYEHFDGWMENAGVHLQCKVLRGINARVVRWGGLDVTTGWEWSGYHMGLSRSLPLTGKVDDMRVSWDAKGTYTLDTTGSSIPIEVSTNARVLMLTGFAGLGVDVNDALGKSLMKLSGDVTGTLYGTDMALAKALVQKHGHGRADVVVGRIFVGAQVNAWMVKLYGQANWGLNGGFGGHTGVRVAF